MSNAWVTDRKGWNSASGSCKVGELANLDKCEAHPQNEYVLNAMQNFANYLNVFHESLQTVFQGVDFSSSNLLETYTDQTDDDDEVFSAGSWLGLASAAIGTFGAFAAPEVAPILGVCDPLMMLQSHQRSHVNLLFNRRVLVACSVWLAP